MSRSTQRRPHERIVSRPGLTRRETQHIRAGRVLSAQARIASGHYDRPEVREYLVEALLEALRSH